MIICAVHDTVWLANHLYFYSQSLTRTGYDKKKISREITFSSCPVIGEKILAFLCFLKSHTALFYLNIPTFFFYFNKDPISVDKT